MACTGVIQAGRWTAAVSRQWHFADIHCCGNFLDLEVLRRKIELISLSALLLSPLYLDMIWVQVNL
jgi:hypothetical protein